MKNLFIYLCFKFESIKDPIDIRYVDCIVVITTFGFQTPNSFVTDGWNVDTDVIFRPNRRTLAKWLSKLLVISTCTKLNLQTDFSEVRTL